MMAKEVTTTVVVRVSYTLPKKPVIGQRLLDYEIYKITPTELYVVNVVNSQTKVFSYKVRESRGNLHSP